MSWYIMYINIYIHIYTQCIPKMTKVPPIWRHNCTYACIYVYKYKYKYISKWNVYVAPYVFTFKMKGVTDINRQPLKFIGKEHQSTVE